MKMPDYSILVTCSDKYFSLIDGFIHFFERNFTDKSIPVFFSMERKKIYHNSAQFIFHNSSSKHWSEGLFETLNIVSTPYVVLLMDDYWLFQDTNLSVLKDVVSFAKESNCDHISFIEKPEDYFHQLKHLNKINETDFYRCSSGKYGSNYLLGVGGVYSVSFLKSILRRYETAWEFEVEASRRYLRYDLNNNYRYSCKENPFKHPWGGIIEKGLLRNSALSDLQKSGYQLNWVDVDVNVSSLHTHVFLRALRKLIRPIRRLLNDSLGKME